MSIHKRSFTQLVIKRRITENCFVFLLQYAGLSITTLIPHSPIWFASGTAFAFTLMRGMTVLPGIFLGTLLAFYLAGANGFTTLISALIFATQAFCLVRACHAICLPTLIFTKLNQFVKFLSYTVVITGLISTSLAFMLSNDTMPVASILAHWWPANLTGTLCISSLLISWDYYFPEFTEMTKRQVRCAVIILACTMISIVIMLYTSALLTCLVSISMLLILLYKLAGFKAMAMTNGLMSILIGLGAFLNVPLFTDTWTTLQLVSVDGYLCVSFVAVTLVQLFAVSQQMPSDIVRSYRVLPPRKQSAT